LKAVARDIAGRIRIAVNLPTEELFIARSAEDRELRLSVNASAMRSLQMPKLIFEGNRRVNRD